jgi:hypothetical protein
MRKLHLFAIAAAALAIGATPALADPAAVTVTLGAALQEKVADLGPREVQQQADRLAETVERAVADDAALDGARIDLVLTDLKPNRPTFQQLSDRPGLDGMRSISVGGATIEGQITTPDGRVLPVRYDWYSSNLDEVRGFAVWQDADRAYRRLADNLADGRYVTR